MRVFEDFKELKSAVGTEVGVSDWVEVTQDRIDKFAEATGDQHVDPERAARELPGGTTIAHGLLSLSLIPMFMRSIIGLKRLRNTLNYGANRIRYLTPVPAGSRLRGRVSVIEAQDARPAGQCGGLGSRAVSMLSARSFALKGRHEIHTGRFRGRCSTVSMAPDYL
jgi:acyl dehydratase